MTDYRTLQQKHVQEMWRLIPEHLERITWSADRLRAERQTRLRRLIRVAKERSSWHRDRLASLDPESVTEDDLRQIPPMTKDEMMANFDAVVTDPRLSRDTVERHVGQITTDAYLFDEFHVVATGGSSGRRGIFVHDWYGFLEVGLALSRFALRAELREGEILPGPRVIIAAETGVHMTVAVPQVFHSPAGENLRIPVSLPIDQIVRRLNEIQPMTIVAYPSILSMLLAEARKGKLGIAPRSVSATGEPFLAEIRQGVEEVWRCPAQNIYGTAEGVSAASCGTGPWMHLNEDLCVFEPVDVHGDPVPPGTAAAKMYITNLSNLAQPLIRYELTDEVTVIERPCPCGSSMRRIGDIQGRLDDTFHYANGVVVHPVAIRSLLYRERNVVEYQVRQTTRGVSLALRADGPVDCAALQQKLVYALACSGREGAEVQVTLVECLERQHSGKLKRFLPLCEAGTA